MARAARCLLLLSLLAHAVQAAQDCPSLVRSWVADQSARWPAERKIDSQGLLYFLHVPRTAGRTSHSCFIRPSTPPSRRCAKSYDGDRFNVSMPNCGLFASHDDHSAMLFLPQDSAVYTSIRNPVTRFLSAYEFAAELGVRGAVRANNTQSKLTAMGSGVDTTDVWPWSYLQPFFQADVSARKV